MKEEYSRGEGEDFFPLREESVPEYYKGKRERSGPREIFSWKLQTSCHAGLDGVTTSRYLKRSPRASSAACKSFQAFCSGTERQGHHLLGFYLNIASVHRLQLRA